MSLASVAKAEPPRVAELVERFRAIGESAMRDLPLYNPALEVEAIGFRPFGQGWIGVLITPWFMNLIRLPEPRANMDLTHVGRKIKLSLPSGERDLMQGGDAVIGAYEALSLHSPMFAFTNPEAARREAERRLEELMHPTPKPECDESGRLTAKPQAMSRRAFLRGESPGAVPVRPNDREPR